MGEPFVPVNYDFGAAGRLSQILKLAAGKVDGYANLRETQRKKQLAKPDSDNWQGGKRSDFEALYLPQQQQLASLADDLRKLMGAVADATERAEAAKSTRRPRPE